MTDREGSRTALASAYLRAAHQLFGGGATQKILGELERYQSFGAKALRSHVVLRSRFTEDRLRLAVQRGIRQYILLEAGFDTFALRQPDWASVLKIIEVDHAGTLALKRSRIAEAKLEIPENVSFVPVDFERESWLDGLLPHGVSQGVPTFFSWLGVTIYLNGATIDASLRSMGAFPEGSELHTAT